MGAVIFMPAKGTTGIHFINQNGNEDEDENFVTKTRNGNVYDLQGRHMPQPSKGLYIMKGKKVSLRNSY